MITYITEFDLPRSVNVYGYKDKKIFLLGITTMTTARHYVNLLYVTAGKTSHYLIVRLEQTGIATI